MRRAVPLLLPLAVALAACGEEKPGLGEEGGGCRVGRQACDEGLICVEGICTAADPEQQQPLQPHDLLVETRLDKSRAIANGRDKVKVSFRIRLAKNGQPYTGAILVRANPTAAARPSPGTVELDEQRGTGGSVLQVCHIDDLGCPSEFTIDLAFPDRPTVVIGFTEPIRLVPPDEAPDAGPDDGG